MPLWALRKAGTSKAFQWSVNRQATYIPFAYLQTLLTAYMMKSRERSACKCSNGRIQFSWKSHIRNCRCSGDICSSGEISCWRRDILPIRLMNCWSNWAEKRIDLHTSAAACAMADVLLSGRRVENEKACNLRHSGSSDCHWCIALALVAKVEQHPVHYGQGVVMRIT